MREYVLKTFNPSKMFTVLKSELIKKKKSRNEKRHLILGQCLVRLVSFMHDNSEDRLLLVLVPLLPTPGDGVT